MRLIVLKSEHSSAFGFFGIVMKIDCARSFGMYPVLNESVNISNEVLSRAFMHSVGFHLHLLLSYLSSSYGFRNFILCY